MNNQIFQYNGNAITFLSGSGDVMVNATEMAKAFGKQTYEYLRLPSTNELIKAKAGKSRISENQLVISKQGSPENGGGTWMHEDIALDFAQWLSVDFKLWCNDRIKELLRNGMTATQPTLEAMVSNPDLVIQLATNLKKEREEKAFLEEQNRLQQKQINAAAPKVEYVDKVLMSQSTYTTNQVAKDLGMSAVTLNRKLCEKRIQYRQAGQWLLYAQYQNKGYTKTHTYAFTRSDGTQGSNMQTVWTEKGRAFIYGQLTVKQKELV